MTRKIQTFFFIGVPRLVFGISIVITLIVNKRHVKILYVNKMCITING